MKYLFLVGIAGTMLAMGSAQGAEVSVSYGRLTSIIGGCQDCHTADYGEMNGKINPQTALKGNPVGYQGPWGTTYAVNLRLLASTMDEAGWVKFLQTLKARPPMPWYNVHALDKTQMASLYRYIVSLGAPGDPAPAYVPPGQKPTSPYVVFAPPTMP